MSNKKRTLNYYKKNLGRYHLTRSDIIAIEKILRIYADVLEKKMTLKHGGRTIPPEGRKHMPRKFADMNVKIGRYKHKLPRFGWLSVEIDYSGVEYVYSADSIKFLHKSLKKARYFQVCCSPGIEVTFSPLKTTIGAQTNYATGKELNVMKEVVKEIEEYLSKSKKAYFNSIKIND